MSLRYKREKSLLSEVVSRVAGYHSKILHTFACFSSSAFASMSQYGYEPGFQCVSSMDTMVCHCQYASSMDMWKDWPISTSSAPWLPPRQSFGLSIGQCPTLVVLTFVSSSFFVKISNKRSLIRCAPPEVEHPTLFLLCTWWTMCGAPLHIHSKHMMHLLPLIHTDSLWFTAMRVQKWSPLQKCNLTTCKRTQEEQFKGFKLLSCKNFLSHIYWQMQQEWQCNAIDFSRFPDLLIFQR